MDSATPPGANTLKSWMEENFFKKCCLMQVEFKQQQQKWKPSHARSRVNSNENGPSELKPQWPKRLKDRLKKKKKIELICFWLPWVFTAMPAFSSCHEQGLLFIAVCRLLIAVTSLVVEHRL